MINNFAELKKNEREILALIEKACEGLVYVSETDAPVAPFAGDIAAIATSETQDADSFFARLTTPQAWHGDDQKERTEKFAELKRLLDKNLRSLKVYRSGTTKVDIFVVGLGPRDRLMGVKTQAVET